MSFSVLDRLKRNHPALTQAQTREGLLSGPSLPGALPSCTFLFSGVNDVEPNAVLENAINEVL